MFAILILVLPQSAGLPTDARRMAAVTTLMAVWWVTEAIPIPATSLLPVVLFPLLKIMPSSQVAPNYMHHLVFFLMGGFLIAAAMQKWNLHQRIALNIICVIGSSPKRLLLGFMVATSFLSLWISNSATTMMVLPVATAVIMEFARSSASVGAKEGDAIMQNFGSILCLSIAYAANIGGVGTLIGTPSNLVFAGMVKELFPASQAVTFLQWSLVGIPVAITMLPMAWVILYYFGPSLPLSQLNLDQLCGRKIVKEKLNALGRMNKGEKLVMAIFLSTVFLWIFRLPMKLGIFTVPGWSQVFPPEHAGYLNDTTVVVVMSLLFFIIPTNLKKGEFILDWETGAKAIPWGTLLLFGSGFAIAEGFETTGLDEWIGDRLSLLSGLPPLLMILILCTLVTFLTEFTSNTATVVMIMPILAATASNVSQHPFLLMIPATLSASFGYMMPAGTAPNAIVFGTGLVKITQMFRVGLLLNITGIAVVTLLSYLILPYVFNITLNSLPEWALSD